MATKSGVDIHVGRPVEALLRHFYFDVPGWKDGTVRFQGLILSRLQPDWVLLDLGAGAGSRVAGDVRTSVRQLIGVDISAEISDNNQLDCACQGDAHRLPFANDSFDAAYADFVLEHLSRPAAAAAELFRVLKPGGLFFARTPNLLHYVGLGSWLTGYKLHAFFKKNLQGIRETEVFPTFYRCNRPTTLRRWFSQAGFHVMFVEMVEAEPTYLMRSPVLFLLGVLYERIVNSSAVFRPLRSAIFACVQKPP